MKHGTEIDIANLPEENQYNKSHYGQRRSVTPRLKTKRKE